ncbi:hypothetical protein [Azospirillum sp. TSA2s]|uniref:hypothetical protein n=1 Tax=Azospirillum sp. TSA2s TaxID=709810 RepID=UPI001FFEA5A7|nr:hypothetical protein [Azospirillum sp. TSA2s]
MTLSAIAREFECTPSAISYIIKKAEAASGQGDAAHGDAGAEGMGAEGMQDEAQAAADTSSAAPETVGEAAAPVTPAVPETPAPAAPAAAEAGTPAEPRRAAGRTGRTTLTRAPRTEPATEQASAETPAAAPAPTETLRLNRPEPAAAPAPAPVAAPAPAQSPVQAPAAPETPRAPGQPTPPVDAVEGRLRDTAKACISAYRGWRQQPSEATIQALSETVHELRKALARVEIDMSASRREEQAIRPIPIPAHRASRRPN